MNINLSFGGTTIKFVSNINLIVEEEYDNFINEDTHIDTKVYIYDEFSRVKIPENYLGRDILKKYYRDQKLNYCVGIGGGKSPITCTIYDDHMDVFHIYLNRIEYNNSLNKLGSIIRLLPINTILQKENVIFMHSSQVVYKDQGIVFAGPSGVGKTTQANLWVKHLNAELVCNDRTLLSKDDHWKTYGFPIDGSVPVRSGAINDLKVIVLLKQGIENKIINISKTKIISKLMHQVIIDGWEGKNREKAMNQLIELIEDIPIYYYECKADEDAVIYLKERLIQDGVIIDE